MVKTKPILSTDEPTGEGCRACVGDREPAMVSPTGDGEL
eukprot:COSAG04_NODE_3207_length_3049_cov_35.068814_3_plen_38_part_01